jgi:O-antigen polysaccharide polymerase Wzy
MCVKKDAIEVDHFFTFSFGYVYYWIIPLGIGVFNQLTNRDELTTWYEVFRQVSEVNIVAYQVVAIISYVFFFLGNFFASKDIDIPALSQELAIGNKYIKIEKFILTFLAGLAVLLVLAFASTLQSDLFQGYKEELFDGYKDGVISHAAERGSFVASTLALLAIAFTYSVRQNLSGFKDSMYHYIFIAYWMSSLLVLSMGGRIYFLSSIIMAMVYKTVYFKKIKLRNLGIAFLILASFAGFYGILRTGGKLDVSDAFFNLFEEPLYTSFSLLSFISESKFNAFNFPIFLLSDFINLLPTNLIPDKSLMIPDMRDYGYNIFAPLGGFNSFVSFEVNFGVVGMCFFLFAAGALLTKLKLQYHHFVFKTMYIMVSGCFAFTLFRDKFSISFVKTMFQFSIMFPILIAVFIRALSSPWRVTQRRKT